MRCVVMQDGCLSRRTIQRLSPPLPPPHLVPPSSQALPSFQVHLDLRQFHCSQVSLAAPCGRVHLADPLVQQHPWSHSNQVGPVNSGEEGGEGGSREEGGEGGRREGREGMEVVGRREGGGGREGMEVVGRGGEGGRDWREE